MQIKKHKTLFFTEETNQLITAEQSYIISSIPSRNNKEMIASLNNSKSMESSKLNLKSTQMIIHLLIFLFTTFLIIENLNSQNIPRPDINGPAGMKVNSFNFSL